ncbi:hypothetical protein BGX23_004577 [Mortierella sp. AD031]|nr:hypothetical protein BGX23_004577 [Mortierella sp. AD031]
MFIKTAALALLAFIATTTSTVSAQVPKHTHFTNPVDGTAVYISGTNTTFSWNTACVKPSTAVSTGSSRSIEVQLVNSNDPNAAFFVAPVTTIDCSKSSGNDYWVVPEVDNNEAFYSLRIMLNRPIYSGRFKITAANKNGGNSGGAGGNGGGSTTVTGDKQTEKHSDNAATGVALFVSALLLH